MTVAQALKDGAARLEQAGASDARVNAGWILSSLTGQARLALPLCGSELDARTLARYESLLTRLATGEPLQYVLGEQEFMGYRFAVDARVLIPREDTAVLVETAVREMGAAPRRVLDIGTGSGAVAVMIDRLCANAQVTAVDISEGALSVAQGNASALGARVRFLKSDLFSALEGERFDGIVSNPPYIRTREIGALQREVQREPLLALDGGEDGLDFYRAIVGGARAHLLPGGKIFLEVGYDQAQEVGALLRAQGFTGIGMQKDWSGIDRVVYAQMGME